MLCYIGIGSNLGDRDNNIKDAIGILRRSNGIKIKRISNVYETSPVGGPPQRNYLNGVMEIETTLKPRELLFILQEIEKELGRTRRVQNGPRTIDLDILLYGDKKIDELDLKVPHPRMEEREFVMKPLRELIGAHSKYDTI